MQREIEDDFIERFLARTAELIRIGDPLDPATTMGPLVSRSVQEKVPSYVYVGRNEGGQLVMGGPVPRDRDPGADVEPTFFCQRHQRCAHRPRGDLRRRSAR